MNEILKDWGSVILRSAIILVVLFFFFWPVKLEGSSMEPTLNDGDIICMSRFFVQMGWYEKGDIVVFQYIEQGKEKVVLKRILATEGDHIRLLADGSVEINGDVLQENYVEGPTNGIVDMTIPKSTVFVMGDNRSTSFDSRNMGVISCDDLTGKVVLRWFPINQMRTY
ncbi:signal peptidase I U [Anaerotignum neopropionicum]|uniref:Signal peptidase I n=1 Tax=Anaerotignum neopropionicum TaxID=36847 RepID=A0A136WC37_9FIRM|nr:signal peptidase I [Anaerotignum neopropionicum]KXL52088.1 signal peptidase I U [Anaerotignum neopropionicum]